MEKKIKVCMITNWYPTEDNPYQGVFFRDQALAMNGIADFHVIHYKSVFGTRRDTHQIEICKTEKNIKEYQLTLYFSEMYNLKCEWKRRFTRKKINREEDSCTRFVKAFEELFKEEFDVLYCVSGQGESKYLMYLSEKYNKPYIVGEHGVVPWLDTCVSEINKKAIMNADLFLAISYEKLRQVMMLGIRPKKVMYIGNMVDDTKFVLKKSNNKIKTLLAVGANVFYKNYEMLFEVINRVKKLSNTPFNLLIVGYGANEGYAREIKEFEERTKKLGIAENIQLISKVHHDEMVHIYNKADAFVMTSIQEGQPVSAMEAGCCGLPIFSTRCGGVEDYVNDEIGRLYGLFDVDGFAQGLCDFLENRIEFDSLTIREQIVNRFGKETFCNNMKSALRMVMDQNNNLQKQ